MNRKTIDYVCFNKDCENNKKGFCYLNGMIPSSGCIDGITKSGLDLKIENMNHRIKDLEEENKQLKESQKQLAISELERVKKFLIEKIAEKQACFDSGCYNDFADGVKTICEILVWEIDKRVKILEEL